jgi:hypothetical protein
MSINDPNKNTADSNEMSEKGCEAKTGSRPTWVKPELKFMSIDKNTGNLFTANLDANGSSG